MKIRISSLILLLFTVFCSGVSAQTQQGIVKTKGRLGANGSIIHGKWLQGATIFVKGRTAVVSGANGTFSFPVPEQNFYLQNVKKQGYLLTDMDILSKQYSYSKENPLYIVMETPDTQTADKLAAERKIRRTLQKTLQQREDEIEQLKAENMISQQEYQQKLQELYSSQEKNEKLISDMAERYSKLDYDQVNGFNRRISELILNGELARADSLINSKGDIHSRKAALQHHQDANAEEEKELAQRQENLSKSRAYTQKELEDLAQDCYHKYEIFKMDFQNDSAAYYLEFRAELDTINVEWQLDAGVAVGEYLATYERALSYFQRALRNALQQYGESHSLVANCYNNIGYIYGMQGIYSLSLLYAQKALAIWLFILPENHLTVAASYNNIGNILYVQNNYLKALEYHTKALEIQRAICGEKHLDVATSYDNIGGVYSSLCDYTKALEFHNKALEILISIYGENHLEIGKTNVSIGNVYCRLRNDSLALNYQKKALSIFLLVSPNNRFYEGVTYYSIGALYHSQGDYVRSLDFCEKGLSILQPIFGENHPNIIVIKNSIENIKNKMQR